MMTDENNETVVNTDIQPPFNTDTPNDIQPAIRSNTGINTVIKGEKKEDGRKRTQFKPGNCANPSGRPKQTQQQKDTLQAIRDLAPIVPQILMDIAKDKRTKPGDRLKALEMIMDRTYGKSPATVAVDVGSGKTADEIRKQLEALKTAKKSE